MKTSQSGDQMTLSSSRFIKSITVRRLFGYFDYDLSLSDEGGEDSKMLILYGDNGSGKTTILKLIFHLLAPEAREGHKSVAAGVPFERFEILFNDNTRVWAQRDKGRLTGSFVMGMKRPRKKEDAKVELIADERNSVNAISEEHNALIKRFLSDLGELQIALFLLSDDRTGVSLVARRAPNLALSGNSRITGF